jgi:hypothetical protein
MINTMLSLSFLITFGDKCTGNQQHETTFALLNTIGKAIQHQGYLMTSWAFDLAALLLDEEANAYTTS